MSFIRPKVSSPPAPPPPVIEDTQATQQQYGDMLRARRGRASAILTGLGGPGTPQTAAKTLLGS